MDMVWQNIQVNERINRCPLAFFYNILYHIICVENNQHLKASTSRRRLFLHQLSEKVTKPEIEVRANYSRIPRVFSTCNAIETIYGPMRELDAAVEVEVERDSTGWKFLHMLPTSTNKKSLNNMQ